MMNLLPALFLLLTRACFVAALAGAFLLTGCVVNGSDGAEGVAAGLAEGVTEGALDAAVGGGGGWGRGDTYIQENNYYGGGGGGGHHQHHGR
ncbi:MAG: hypothetical protein WEC73_02795 [Chthoniobacterales bacterium]